MEVLFFRVKVIIFGFVVKGAFLLKEVSVGGILVV